MRTPKGRGSGSSCLWQWCKLNSCPKVWLLWRGNNCQLCYTSAIGCTLFLFFGQRLGEGSFPGFEPGVHWLQGQNSATKLKPCGCTLYKYWIGRESMGSALCELQGLVRTTMAPTPSTSKLQAMDVIVAYQPVRLRTLWYWCWRYISIAGEPWHERGNER